MRPIDYLEFYFSAKFMRLSFSLVPRSMGQNYFVGSISIRAEHQFGTNFSLVRLPLGSNFAQIHSGLMLGPPTLVLVILRLARKLGLGAMTLGSKYGSGPNVGLWSDCGLEYYSNN